MTRITARVALAVALATGMLIVLPSAPARADGNEAPGAPETYRSITAGESHNCAIRYDGAVRCWGQNFYGQLGLGDTAHRGDEAGELADLPTVDLGTGRTATSITAGSGHTSAILDNGQVKCWGGNQIGQLGSGDTAPRGDQPGEMGDNLPAVDLGTGRTAVAVTAGQSHTCAILDNGRVKCWGFNASGHLGLGDTATRGDQPGEMGDALPTLALGPGRRATAISAGESQTCALLDNSAVVCWGSNEYGKLGRGDAVGAVGDAPGEMGGALVPVDLGTGNTATAIGAGSSFTCALYGVGRIKCWGRNNVGQLGAGDQVARGSTPESMGDALLEVPLSNSWIATSLAVGNSHVCAVLSNRDLKCWGYNVDGQLGLGDTANRGDAADELGNNLPAVSLGRRPVAVTTGDLHTCALLETEQIRCWGANLWGQLGVGDTNRRGDGPGEMGLTLPAVGLRPANDDFADAELLTGARGMRTGVNANAAPEALEPQHAGIAFFQTSIWYSWTSATGGRTRFDVTDAYDAVGIIAVYTGTDVGNLTEVDSAAPTMLSEPVQVDFQAVAGQTYHVVIAGVFASGSGRTQLTWANSAPCDGQPVTVDLALGDSPTEGPDVIRGTGAPDTVNGLGGADRICGGNGADTITGGTGPAIDRIFGEGGNDTLRGLAGNDRLDGGNQNDRLIGDGGNDNLNGQAGNDTILGGTGTDRLNGGSQRDSCNGGPQADTHSGCEVRTSIP